MRLLKAICVLLLVGTVWVAKGEVSGFDKDNYPPLTLTQAVEGRPCARAEQAYEIKDCLFSAEVVFQGAVRETPKRSLELVRRWAGRLGDRRAAVRYGREISLAEGKKVNWVAVPDGLLPILQSDLRAGDRALAYMVFVGCVEGEPLLAIDEFDDLDGSGDEDQDVVVRLPPAETHEINASLR